MSQNITRLRDLSKHQVQSGLAAWLGWLFDGLDMHIYTLVATPFVAELLHLQATPSDPRVGYYGAIINAGFLMGWAFGGAIFGRIGDLLGRSRTLVLTILTYACFTGLSVFATTWWHLLICRFVSALGIGGEWAVGASLLSETWPKAWRPWIAATLQCAVNVGVLFACLAGELMQGLAPRWIFLVGIVPALITLWIRKAVPETEEWTAARASADAKPPRIRDLFAPGVSDITWRVLVICGVSLTAHWALLFWFQADLRNLPEIKVLDVAGKNHATVMGLFSMMLGSLIGNYTAGALAKWLGYRNAIVLMLAAYFGCMMGAYGREWGYEAHLYWLAALGLFQGVFSLFTMCLPPLFPTLLRTTGAGFCYNFGRVAAAVGTVLFGLFVTVGDFRHALLYAGFLFVPATLVAFLLPEEKEEDGVVEALLE